MAYVDFKELTRRAFFDKILSDKTFNIAKNPLHDEYEKNLASMVSKAIDKKTSGS